MCPLMMKVCRRLLLYESNHLKVDAVSGKCQFKKKGLRLVLHQGTQTYIYIYIYTHVT